MSIFTITVQCPGKHIQWYSRTRHYLGVQHLASGEQARRVTDEDREEVRDGKVKSRQQETEGKLQFTHVWPWWSTRLHLCHLRVHTQGTYCTC